MPNVNTIDEFMENIPICCTHNKLKKILWEELHMNPDSGIDVERRELNTAIKRTRGAYRINTFVTQKSKRSQHSNTK